MKRVARLIIFYAGLLGVWTLLAELKSGRPTCFPRRGAWARLCMPIPGS